MWFCYPCKCSCFLITPLWVFFIAHVTVISLSGGGRSMGQIRAVETVKQTHKTTRSFGYPLLMFCQQAKPVNLFGLTAMASHSCATQQLKSVWLLANGSSRKDSSGIIHAWGWGTGQWQLWVIGPSPWMSASQLSSSFLWHALEVSPSWHGRGRHTCRFVSGMRLLKC